MPARACALCFILLAPVLGWAADDRPVKLTVEPSAVELTTARDSQGLVVQAEYADGSTRDVTREAGYSLDDSKVAAVRDGMLFPTTDGSAKVTVGYAGLSCNVPVTVRRAKETDPLRFRLDVLPLLTRVGCNTGKCHGSASGK